MSKFLLDTNVALLAARAPERLSKQVRLSIMEGQNVLSVVSYWEVVLKSMKGKLDVGAPQTWWQQSLEQLRAKPLSISVEHVSAVSTLPAIHQDPFDRMLIAQASVAGLVLLTTDGQIQRYAGPLLRVQA